MAKQFNTYLVRQECGHQVPVFISPKLDGRDTSEALRAARTGICAGCRIAAQGRLTPTGLRNWFERHRVDRDLFETKQLLDDAVAAGLLKRRGIGLKSSYVRADRS